MTGRALISFVLIACIMMMDCSAFVGLQQFTSSVPVRVHGNHHVHVAAAHQQIRVFVPARSLSLLYYSIHGDAFKTDDLPEWATVNQCPPNDQTDVEILFLGSDDFVSMELENDESTATTFCAAVVYDDARLEPQFLVEPLIGTIEPNGGILEVTVKPIINEDADDEQSFLVPTCWLVISTETDTWHYKLEASTTPS